MIASIPSPDVGTLSLGPLNLRLYGLMVALGVIAGVYLAARYLQRHGLNPEWAVQVSVLGVPFGLIGARAYHVLTDWKSYQDRWIDVLKIWEGGLGIPGGFVGAVLGGLIVVRYRKLPLGSLLDSAAVGFPMGQVIGRLGNWFNQELFGRPTDLPWGLEIDPQHRPPAFADDETFHPTFAYEMVWNLLLIWLILRLDRRGRVPRGHLIVLYLAGYSAGRLWIEALRIDPASLLLGVRVNIWVMGAVLLASLLWLLFVTRPRLRPPVAALDDGSDAPTADEPAEAAPVAAAVSAVAARQGGSTKAAEVAGARDSAEAADEPVAVSDETVAVSDDPVEVGAGTSAGERAEVTAASGAGASTYRDAVSGAGDDEGSDAPPAGHDEPAKSDGEATELASVSSAGEPAATARESTGVVDAAGEADVTAEADEAAAEAGEGSREP